MYDQIMTEYKRIEKQITILENKLKSLPKGTLISNKNGKYFKYYKREGTEIRYLKRNDLQLTKELALKKYFTAQLKDLKQEKLALHMYLNHHSSNKSSLLLSESSGLLPFLESNITFISKDLQEWSHATYDMNLKYPEQLIHKTLSGHVVRSKSEALIDTMLYQHQIPFRYECPLQINDIVFYPDFTLRHPTTGQTMYWEHFGMIDNPTYSKNVFYKLQSYSSIGLIPTIHIITTYETEDHPLTMDIIEKNIEFYFK